MAAVQAQLSPLALLHLLPPLLPLPAVSDTDEPPPDDGPAARALRGTCVALAVAYALLAGWAVWKLLQLMLAAAGARSLRRDRGLYASHAAASRGCAGRAAGTLSAMAGGCCCRGGDGGYGADTQCGAACAIVSAGCSLPWSAQQSFHWLVLAIAAVRLVFFGLVPAWSSDFFYGRISGACVWRFGAGLGCGDRGVGGGGGLGC